jgi:hypothetical protein
MIDWLTTGGLVDIAIACIFLEAAALWVLRRRWSSFAHPAGVAANLVAGAMLLLAVRVAIADGHWSIVVACLTGALVAHAADIGMRLHLFGKPSPEAAQPSLRRPP